MTEYNVPPCSNCGEPRFLPSKQGLCRLCLLMLKGSDGTPADREATLTEAREVREDLRRYKGR